MFSKREDWDTCLSPVTSSAQTVVVTFIDAKPALSLRQEWAGQYLLLILGRDLWNWRELRTYLAQLLIYLKGSGTQIS